MLQFIRMETATMLLRIRAGTENNSASINQQGSYNHSEQIQDGSSNNAQTVIAGSNNETYETQTGDRNFSYTASSYNTHYNVMTVTQTGDNNYDNSRIRGNRIGGK